jgi:carbon monoxide dehydrogenase subunit G
MKVSHQDTVPAPVDEVWRAVTDVTAIGRLPGATQSTDGDTVTGSVKARLGTTQITYRISGGVVSCDAAARRLALSVTGMEARGGGNLVATLTVSLDDAMPGTQITVDGDVTATGRGAAADAAAWERVITRLLDAAISDTALGDAGGLDVEAPAPAASPPEPPAALAANLPPFPGESSPTTAGVAPLAAAIGGLCLLIWWFARRRS